MNFEEYQRRALDTSIMCNKDDFVYPVLGITGEAGEVAEKVKKIIRDKKGILNKADAKELAKELGDVLWYITRMAWSLDYSLEDVARMNIEKFESRRIRGTTAGSGDNR